MWKTPVFVHIPKTAGNSVRTALAGAIDMIDIGHSTVRRRGLTGPDYFRFCFVRDPLARLKSAFFHLTDLPCTPDVETDAFNLKRKQLHQTYGYDFRRFVADAGFAKYALAHFLPQTRWTHHNEGLMVDFIGKVEDMENEWVRLGQKLCVTLPPLPHRNVTRNELYKKHLQLEPELVQMVKNFYIEDYVRLGYEMVH